MNQDQIITVKMAKAVISLFDKFIALWTGLLPITESVNKIKAYLTGIDTASQEQSEKTTKGITTDKNEQRKLMIALTLVVIAKIRPYAKRSNNNELLHQIDYAESELSQVKEDTCVKRCTTVLARGRELLTPLKDYKLTESELVALESAILPFENLNEKRDVTIGERMSATQKIEQLLPLLRAEFKILDDLVKGEMPEDFQSDYKNIR